MRLPGCFRRARLGSLAVFFACPIACAAGRVAAQTPTTIPGLGTIDFPTSGSPAAQREFLHGVLLLHSFEYTSAENAFRRAEALAPDFAMAYWGEAMTYNHGVWNEQDLTSARQALGRLGPTLEARRAKAPTPREQRYLEAVEALYGDGSKPRRDTLYASVIERLVRENPADLDAKAFYALALLGLNQGIRDTVTYLRAAPYADTVFRANPNHPGAAHYLIHSFDDPIHAAKGLEAARAYSRIAPEAAHAQHMTTHIFLALGMWDDVVSQNRIAVGLTSEVPGHYTSWLAYGMIQQGRWAEAKDLVERLRNSIKGGGLPSQHTALAETRGHLLLHTEDWRSGMAGWSLDHDKMSVTGELADRFTAGVMAYARRDAAELGVVAGGVARLAEALQTDRGPRDPATMAGQVMARELGAMQLFMSDRREDAIRQMQEATAIEDAMPMEFGPPVILSPSHELLGTMLLEMRPAQSAREFLRALVLAPGRARSLEGLTRAAVASGDKATAQRAIDQLAAIWHAANPRLKDEILPLRQLVAQMP
jgi:hypothetical protein